MKHIVFYILFLLPVLAFSQSRYAIMKVPYCWTTDAMVDSSINRVILVTTQTSAPTTLYFSDVNGDTVNVSGGTLSFGYCDCCSGGTTGNVVTAINGLTNISPDSIKLGGFLVESTEIDAAGNDFDILNIDTSMYLGDFLAFVGNERLKLNSVFFPRNDGFDGQALRYDASGDSLQWYTPSTGVNIYNADGAQTDQIRTDTLGGKTLVFDGRTGTGDTSTMVRLQADFSTDDSKTTFLSMETGAAGTPTDSLIFYDYDTSFKIESSSNLNIIADNYLQLDTDSMFLSLNGNYGNGPGTYFIDQRVAPRGIEYQSLDYIPTLSDSSLVPKKYVDDEITANQFWTRNSGRLYPTILTDNVGVGIDPSTLGKLVVQGSGTGSGLGLKVTDSGGADILRIRDDRIAQFGSSSYSRLIELYTQPSISDLYIFSSGGNALRVSHNTSVILERSGATVFEIRASVGPGATLGNFGLSSAVAPISAATQVGSAYGSWSGRLWNGSAAPYANFNFRFSPSTSINNYGQFLLDYNTDTTPGDQSGRFGGNGIITNLFYVDNNANAKLFGTGGFILPKGTTAQRSYTQREAGAISYDTDRNELSLSVSGSANVTFQNYKAGSTTDTTDGSGQVTITHGVSAFTPNWAEVNIVGSNTYFAKPVSIDGTNLIVEVRDAGVLGATPVTATSVTLFWKVMKL